MVQKENKSNSIIGNLLTTEERKICRKISRAEAGLVRQRAAALMALDEGLTSAEVSARASLTIGQIQYLRSAFSKKRLLVFPQDMLLKEKKPAKTKEKTKKEKKVKNKAKRKDDGKKKNKEQKQIKKKQNKKKKSKKKMKKNKKKAKKNKSKKAESTKK